MIIWKANVSSHEYRQTFQTVLNSLKIYNTRGWIADLRNQGIVSTQDQIWLVNTVIPEAVKCGLKKVAYLGMEAPERLEYYERLKSTCDELKVELRCFGALNEAMAWMQEKDP